MSSFGGFVALVKVNDRTSGVLCVIGPWMFIALLATLLPLSYWTCCVVVFVIVT